MSIYRIMLLLGLLAINEVLLGQNELLNKIGDAASKRIGDKGADLRESLDSVDFQFAISINQGAGFFDVEQKGETGSKLLYGFKATEDKSRTELARDSLDIAIGMYSIRRYEMSERLLKRVKSYMEDYRLQEEIVYLRVVSNMGLISLTQGKLFEAGQFINQSLVSSQQKLGKESPAYIANLNNNAKLLHVQGKYAEAENLFDQAYDLALEVFGGGMQVAIILNNKSMLYQTLGQYERAIEVMHAAIDISQQAPKKVLQGEKSFDNRKFNANLAMLYQVAGEYTKAETLFLEIKKIFENRGQKKSAEYAGLTNQLALLYIQMGKYDQVRDLMVVSLNVYKKRWGERNIYFAKVANDLGDFHRMRGEYKEASEWLNKSFGIRKELLAQTHPDFIHTQESLALLYWKTGKNKEALTYYKEVMSKTMDIVKDFFPSMSEVEKTHFWDITSPRFQRFYNFAISRLNDQPEIISYIYEYNLATKGILLSATTRVRNTILNSGNQALINDYLTWLDKKDQLGRLYGYSKGKLKKQNIDLKALEDEANAIEKDLSQRSGEFSTAFSSKNLSYDIITDQLADDEAVVDLVRVTKFDQDFTDDIYYLAMISKNGLETPAYVLLENGSELESSLAKYYRRAIQFNVSDKLSYKKFWEGIEGQLSGIDKVFFSPDGIYNQININTLRLPDGDYIIHKHNLVVIGNSADIVGIKSAGDAIRKKDAFLLGFPTYGSADIPELPGTKVEIDEITGILQKGGYVTDQYMEEKASETIVKSIAGPSLVHIATHGFFQADKQDVTSSFGLEAEKAGNNPLLRSGLILAGSGGALKDTTSVEITSADNGILTAYEAMNLNLEGTQLVVLSACETGLGQIKSGEGVYGLQRAFQLAGVNALIMSLWKVSDEATQELMVNFYSNWSTGGSIQDAFHKAQLQLMQKYNEPYFWGAFVMIGS